MIIAIDFDDTIARTNYPEIIEPVPGALSSIHKLHEQGHILILWTLREGDFLEMAENWLKKWGLSKCFKYINANIPKEVKKWDADPRKIAADLYIDDRAIGWQGWHQVRQYFCLD